jgi:hypothetical protein
MGLIKASWKRYRVKVEICEPVMAGSKKSAETPQWMASFNTPSGLAAETSTDMNPSIPKMAGTITAKNNLPLTVPIAFLPAFHTILEG